MWLSDLTRFIQFACVLGLFGTTSWALVRSESSSSARALSPNRWLLVLCATSLIAAAATVSWILIEATMVAGGWRAAAEVVASARFGQAAALRAALLLLAALVALMTPPRNRMFWALLASLFAAAIVSFIGTGHGSTGTGAAAAVHAVADALHLFCAAMWLGALVVLSASGWQALATRSPDAARTLLKDLLQLSAIGPALIGLLIVTGLINTWLLLDEHWSALLSETYGRLLIGKVGVFAAMLGLAAYHRYRSTPRLGKVLADASSSVRAIGTLQRTLIAELVLALLVLAIVAVLGALEPPASA